tara:strand:+ start:72 stop:386 length:315 start_codon:yes stop_codon:yes gene_type:complete
MEILGEAPAAKAHCGVVHQQLHPLTPDEVGATVLTHPKLLSLGVQRVVVVVVEPELFLQRAVKAAEGEVLVRRVMQVMQAIREVPLTPRQRIAYPSLRAATLFL